MSSLDVRAIDESDLPEKPAPAAKSGFRVFFDEAAFDRAVARGGSDTSREIGGVLVGELLRDRSGPYLRISTTIDALHAEEKGAELTFTHATWDHINKEMDAHHDGKRVVGWYHTHPGFGVFLSDRDQFIHKSFFNLPFQVAFVYDPKSREHGLFTWHDNAIARARGYWIGEREQLWDGPRTADDKPESTRPEPEERRRPERPAEPSFDGSAGTIAAIVAVGVILLLVGAFAGHWWGSASANAAIGEVQRQLVKAHADGAEQAIASIDSDLVSILRQSLGDGALRKPIADATAAIDGLLPQLDAQGAADPKASELATRLREARSQLAQVATDRSTSEVMLAQLELATRRRGQLRSDLSRDVTEQRTGLGALYAELAADVAKAGDKARAKRLLAVAAHLDPGNRARYEQQLRTFDKTATLSRGAGVGSGGAK